MPTTHPAQSSDINCDSVIPVGEMDHVILFNGWNRILVGNAGPGTLAVRPPFVVELGDPQPDTVNIPPGGTRVVYAPAIREDYAGTLVKWGSHGESIAVTSGVNDRGQVIGVKASSVRQAAEQMTATATGGNATITVTA